MGLYADEECRLINQLEIHTLKVREADKSFDSFSINWNMEKMDFSQVDREIEKVDYDLSSPASGGIVEY